MRGRDASVALSSVQRRCVSAVAERIESGQYELLHDRCVCGENEAVIIARVDRYGLPLDTVLCARCGTLRFDPYLSAEALAEFYVRFYQDMYARATDPDAYLRRERSYGRRLLAFAQSLWRDKALVVEVGCGAGGALALFRESGHRVEGCDYSEPLLDRGRNRGLTGLRSGGIEAIADRFVGAGEADLVVLHHVLEHLSAPADVLATAKRMLSDRGMIVIAVPDIAGIDRFPFPSGNLRLFLHIAHKYNFTANGLAALARRIGLSASLVPVEPSKEAPEMWVALAPQPVAGIPLGNSLSGSEDVLRELRRVERKFLRHAILEKLGALFHRRSPSA